MSVHSVLFRTGGSTAVGFGHVRRCLSLAQALRVAGVASQFLVDGDEKIIHNVDTCGFHGSHCTDPASPLEVLSRATALGAGTIVCDSYAFDAAYYRSLAASGLQIVAVDDLADRELPVDIVVNGALDAEGLPYQRAPGTEFLLGPAYALLRPEFSRGRRSTASGQVRRALISVGGSDPHQLTPRLIPALAGVAGISVVDVVAGPLFDHDGDSGPVNGVDVVWHRSPDDIRAVMLNADVAVSAGGQTLYELAATGVPCVAVRTAANQTQNLRAFDRAGVVVWAGDVHDPALEETVQDAVTRMSVDPEGRAAMSRNGPRLVDGHGAQRVARVMVQKRQSVR